MAMKGGNAMNVVFCVVMGLVAMSLHGCAAGSLQDALPTTDSTISMYCKAKSGELVDGEIEKVMDQLKEACQDLLDKAKDEVAEKTKDIVDTDKATEALGHCENNGAADIEAKGKSAKSDLTEKCVKKIKSSMNFTSVSDTISGIEKAAKSFFDGQGLLDGATEGFNSAIDKAKEGATKELHKAADKVKVGDTEDKFLNMRIVVGSGRSQISTLGACAFAALVVGGAAVVAAKRHRSAQPSITEGRALMEVEE